MTIYRKVEIFFDGIPNHVSRDEWTLSTYESINGREWRLTGEYLYLKFPTEAADRYLREGVVR